MLTVGNPAPVMDLPSDDGNRVQIPDPQGRAVALFFYPKDMTPGCTTESKDFRDLKSEFDAANTLIVGISKDSLDSHAKFRNKEQLNFPLASDEGEQIAEAYGVWMEKSMYGKKYMGIDRSTFLIDAAGQIVGAWQKVKVPGHAAEVLEAAKALAKG